MTSTPTTAPEPDETGAEPGPVETSPEPDETAVPPAPSVVNPDADGVDVATTEP